MRASHECILPNLSLISRTSIIVQIYPGISNTTILSIRKVYDNNYTAIISKREYVIYKNKPFILVLKTKRCSTIGMYTTKLLDPLLQKYFVS